jgi:homoserine O-acetyltransferase
MAHPAHDPVARGLSLGDFPLDGGGSLSDAVLGYKARGRLDATGTNAILIPCYYTGDASSYDGLIGPGRALDPERFLIVAVDLFGNGRSTSPSHAATPADRARFPAVSIADNVRAQRRLADHLGIRRFALIHGWSMGAIQSWFWAAMYPEMVEAILPVCGAARCWPQNRAFLEGIRAALTADAIWAGGAYTIPPAAGLRAFGRAYLGWAFSPRFLREEMWRGKGHTSLEEVLLAWEEDHLAWDAADLLAMLATWAGADIGDLDRPGSRSAAAAPPPGTNAAATDAGAATSEPAAAWRAVLGRITARAIVMPCDEDRYFTLEENALEVACVPGAELRPIRSPCGHSAGAPGRWPRETAEIEAAVAELTRGGGR